MQITDQFQFPILAPSIIAADWMRMEGEIQSCLELGLPWLHCDVMDGHFVPNITFGPDYIKAIKKQFPRAVCDAHLMVSAPSFWIPRFMDAGASVITVHVENCTTEEIMRWSGQCEEAGIIFGLAIRPTTSLDVLKPWLSFIKIVNVMSVYPGFYGQSYIEGSETRVAKIRSWVSADNVWIKVDGGVTLQTAQLCVQAGADILVAGATFFKAKDRKSVAKAFANLVEG